jgi:hypothetical protein
MSKMPRRWSLTRRSAGRVAALAVMLALLGCRAPGPTPFPLAPLAERLESPGRLVRTYDVSGDGAADFEEHLVDGRVRVLVFDADSPRPQRVERPDRAARHLVVILDSVPIDMVREAYAAGRFRLFYPPAALVSVFPAMTDPALAEYFGAGPCLGVESAYYDGRALSDAADTYLHERNAPWAEHVDYRVWLIAHAWLYRSPLPWLAHELGQVQRKFMASDAAQFTAYVVSPSSLGSHLGRDGHAAVLAQVDRLCQRIMYDTRGQVEITLFSDHGHAFGAARRVRLGEGLHRLGWSPATRLRSAEDVIVPEWGLVSCAAVYTRQAAAVARDLASLEGVELAAYREGDTVVVVGRSGRGRVERCCATGFTYRSEGIDPLGMDVPASGGALAACTAAGDGICGSDRLLAERLRDGDFPDAVQRLWRAFDGLFEHAPDVLVSLEDGWYCGSSDLTSYIRMRGVHGNLRRDGSLGFAMTTLGPLPDNIRIAGLAAELAKLSKPRE